MENIYSLKEFIGNTECISKFFKKSSVIRPRLEKFTNTKIPRVIKTCFSDFHRLLNVIGREKALWKCVLKIYRMIMRFKLIQEVKQNILIGFYTNNKHWTCRMLTLECLVRRKRSFKYDRRSNCLSFLLINDQILWSNYRTILSRTEATQKKDRSILVIISKFKEELKSYNMTSPCKKYLALLCRDKFAIYCYTPSNDCSDHNQNTSTATAKLEAKTKTTKQSGLNCWGVKGRCWCFCGVDYQITFRI